MSALGDYSKYRCVFYRVYIPVSNGSSRSRELQIVVTNFGPLAITSANLLSAGESSDVDFLLGFITPITLVTTLGRDALDLLDNPVKIVTKLMNNLSLCTRNCIEPLESLKKNNMGSDKPCAWHGVKDGVITCLSLEDEWYECSIDCSSSSGFKLPVVVLRRARIVVKRVGDGFESNFSGWLGMALVPLTGSFTIRDSDSRYLVVFRESSGSDIRFFGEVLEATYLKAIRVLAKCLLEKIQGAHTITFLVDTTHGLNVATTLMSRVLEDALPLIRYEVLSQGLYWQEPKALYYNSDPALGLGRTDRETLCNTCDNNISYYYVSKTLRPLNQVAKNVEVVVLGMHRINESLLKKLQGIYLLRYGLIPWGFYNIELHGDTHSGINSLIEVRARSPRDRILEVRYKISEDIKRNAYAEIIASWLAELAEKCINKLAGEVKVEPVNCWGEPVKDSIRCYSLEKVKELISTRDKEDWAKRFLNEVVEETAKLILLHEINQWLKEPLPRLGYWIPYAFMLREVPHDKRCSEIFREAEVNGGYYCVTPMRVQSNIRNIIAHVGLTSVHRLVAFLFKDKCKDTSRCASNDVEEYSCRPDAICIAAPFPFDMFVRELRGHSLGSS